MAERGLEKHLETGGGGCHPTQISPSAQPLPIQMQLRTRRPGARCASWTSPLSPPAGSLLVPMALPDISRAGSGPCALRRIPTDLRQQKALAPSSFVVSMMRLKQIREKICSQE